MGFYHPATIVGDAARHGQVIRPLDVNHSDWLCAIEADGTVRLGLRYVRGLREEAGRRMERARPFTSADDLVRRAGLRSDELARLAELGALGSLGLERRAALWEVERAARPSGPLYNALDPPPEPSPLLPMTPTEAMVADYEGSGLSLGPHPMTFHRVRLERSGWCGPPISRACGTAAPCGWREQWWCASGPAPPRASSSSISRTRPVSSTWWCLRRSSIVTG